MAENSASSETSSPKAPTRRQGKETCPIDDVESGEGQSSPASNFKTQRQPQVEATHSISIEVDDESDEYAEKLPAHRRPRDSHQTDYPEEKMDRNVAWNRPVPRPMMAPNVARNRPDPPTKNDEFPRNSSLEIEKMPNADRINKSEQLISEAIKERLPNSSATSSHTSSYNFQSADCIDESVQLISKAIKKLKQLSNSHPTSSHTSSFKDGSERSDFSNPYRWSIFKVPHRLRQVNKKAYKPSLISIGPYYHGKKHLVKMEIFKKSSLTSLIGENKAKAEAIVEAMMEMEDAVRKCYPDSLPPHMYSPDEFLKMMILDGCFIIDLFDREQPPRKSFFVLNRILSEIYHDLLLLENQLPFFVLSELYCLLKTPGDAMSDSDSLVNSEPFARSALKQLGKCVPGPVTFPENSSRRIKHLLGLVHDSWIPQDKKVEGELSKFIRCAKELEEAGIKFVKKDKDGAASSLFDICFRDAKLKIPELVIGDNTELILRNFLAYEQFIPINEPTYVCDYVVFMDNLIDSGKDVQLLRHSGVIVNWLGDDEAVANMFNRLRDFTYSTEHSFYYKAMYDEVDKHCQRKWNKWKAKLRKDYFNSPWSIISVIAAIVLLLLTAIQTIFSVLSYVYQ